MNSKLIKSIISEAIEKLDKINFDFYDEENEEDFKDVLEGVVVGLDELEEIVERDEAYRDAMNAGDDD
jgi:hypothetical protein|tara:strand:- start:2671 stop:2874 length:204 start_codon:yes stop_codon:yes gene_type:complete